MGQLGTADYNRVIGMQVYNEGVTDLLRQDAGHGLGRGPLLKIKENSAGSIYVEGLQQVLSLAFTFPFPFLILCTIATR